MPSVHVTTDDDEIAPDKTTAPEAEYWVTVAAPCANSWDVVGTTTHVTDVADNGKRVPETTSATDGTSKDSTLGDTANTVTGATTDTTLPVLAPLLHRMPSKDSDNGVGTTSWAVT